MVVNYGAELRSEYSGFPPAPQPLSERQARAVKRGYYAATSFTDAQIGRVLAELRRLGLEDKTLIVLWGDHGWHLGEHAQWTKHTNFEVATRSPLIFRVPGQLRVGTQSAALVEFVDVYPTVCELAGLPIPNKAAHGGFDLAGRSLVQFIQKPWLQSKKGAFSQWSHDGYVGHSMRTDRYRFTEWVKTGVPKVYELYDHLIDPKENRNVAGQPAYRAVAAKLLKALKNGGNQDLPPTLLPQ
jgi:arylsulfatase A-like enzyme